MLKVLFKSILILSLGLILESCATEQTADDNVITLRISTWASSGDSPQEIQIFKAYEASHPNIRIKNVYTPWTNYTEKNLVLTVGGIAPDLIWMIPTDLPSYASRNVIMDLTQQVSNDPEIDTTNYFPHALDLCSYKGRIYGLPRDVCCWFYAYNKRLFDESHVPYPTGDWTWDDFLKTCSKLTKDKHHSGHIDQFGTAWWSYNDAVRQNGGQELSPDGTQCWITKPEFYEAIQWWVNLALKYHVAPKGSEISGFGGDLFQNQVSAMTLAGPWVFSTYKKNLKFPYDIVNLPRGKAGNKAMLLGLPIAISTKTKHAKEAYDFLKFLTYSKEAQSLQAQLGVGTPSRKDMAMSDIYVKQPINPKHIDLYLKSMMEYTFVPEGFTYSKLVGDQINAAIEYAQLGEMTAKQAMELKKPFIDKIIQKAIERNKHFEKS